MPRNLALSLLLTLALGAPVGVSAQIPEVRDTAALRREAQNRLGRNLSHAEMLERLRQSGLSRAQVRARLQQAGYDPGLADQYFDLIESGGEPPRGTPSDEFVDALQRVGVAARSTRADTLMLDSPADSLAVDSLYAPIDTLEVRGPQIFGLNMFRRSAALFQPMQFGPVDRDYRIGPGDEIILIVTGDVELAYTLDVSREGNVVIPDVGTVSVHSLTLDELEDRLFDRMRRVFSGISRDPGASTRFQVSLGRLRTNQIFVAGDVVRPAAYQISSVAGLFNALYQAGGPTEYGSFRHIEVHRGGRVVEVADIYDYLIRGDSRSDIRLEHNDRVFVPPVGAQVRVEGSVRRPAIYEVKPGESIRDVLAFAGGLRSDALVRRVQIDRILPPSAQTPGSYRRLIDVDLSALTGPDTVPVLDGDVVSVFTVSDERRNRLFLEGQVRAPGLYEWEPGTTLTDLIRRADGLGESAYISRAHIYREVQQDGRRRLIQASLVTDSTGRFIDDLPLMDGDSVVVYSREDLRNAATVSIDGYVKHPDSYPLPEGMTLKDLILAAGGFIHGAYYLEAEVSRLANPLQRTDTTAEVFRVRLDDQGNMLEESSSPGVPYWPPDAGDLILRHGDRVFIRRAPGYELVREVKVTGEVAMPGTYVLSSRDERLSELISRAGGLTQQAYPAGIHVVRSDRIVAADLQRALRDPRDRNNLALTAGDSIHVPAYDPTVVVTGAVNFEARVLYVPGRGLDYYIAQAGGYADAADEDRTTVTYQNGERSVADRGWLSRGPRIQPGSQVFVPAKPEGRTGLNWDQIAMRGAALLSAVATIAIAVAQLR